MAEEYKGFASPSSITAIIFIIIGIIMAVIGIIILISETGNKSWYVWVLLIGGIIFAIIGSIMLTIERSKMKMDEKTIVMTPLTKTLQEHQIPAHTHITQHPASSHIDLVNKNGTNVYSQLQSPAHTHITQHPASSHIDLVESPEKAMIVSTPSHVHPGHVDIVSTPSHVHPGHVDTIPTPSHVHPGHVDIVSTPSHVHPGHVDIVSTPSHVHPGIINSSNIKSINRSPIGITVKRTVYPGTAYDKHTNTFEELQ